MKVYKKNGGQLLSADKLKQASFMLHVQGDMADSQSKGTAGEAGVCVEHLARRRDTEYYFQTRNPLQVSSAETDDNQLII